MKSKLYGLKKNGKFYCRRDKYTTDEFCELDNDNSCYIYFTEDKKSAKILQESRTQQIRHKLKIHRFTEEEKQYFVIAKLKGLRR